MKKHILFFMILSVLCYSCQDNYIGQYPTDSVPPAPVSNVKVDNQPGKAVIHYQLPDVSDLMGVKAKYTSPTTGQHEEAFSSAYVNSLVLKGFGRSTPTQVTLVAIDQSYNESEPVTVQIEPQDSPIYDIVNNMQVFESFGGLKLMWNNDLREGISITVQMKDEEGNYVDLESFYSDAKDAAYSIRNLANEPTDFAFICRDYFGNETEPVYMTLTPLYEEKLDKTKFKAGFYNASKFPKHSYGGDMPKMWDNTYNVDNNLFYLQNGTEPYEPVNFSFDLGVVAKLSRFRLWTRVNYIYQLHHIRTFELYGTTDPAVFGGQDSYDGWELILEGESLRPSGATEGGTPTADEKQFVMDGEEWEFDVSKLPVVRYLRIKVLSTWGVSHNMFINEMDFWGEVQASE